MAVAFITGSSRGIGKAIAIGLAEDGYDIALTARTVTEGERREHSSTIARSDDSPLPGSLSTTAEAVRTAGVRALVVAADLLDLSSLTHAVERTVDELGPIDVLVNNGRYIGPGHMDRVLDTPIEILQRHLDANVVAPVHLINLVLPAMVARRAGAIVNITSGVAFNDPEAPAGEGGWGLGYAVSKGGFHRIASVLAVEHRDDGIRAWNVQPGLIATERLAQDMQQFGFDAALGAPPEVVAAVVSWLLRDPDAVPNGSNVEAQEVCAALELLPGWTGPPDA